MTQKSVLYVCFESNIYYRRAKLTKTNVTQNLNRTKSQIIVTYTYRS